MNPIRIRPAGTGAGTHVLAIGVGWYRHLIDGPEQRKHVHMGLSVLESPPKSAEALVRWMLGGDGHGSGLNNPDAPLTTIEVLISSRDEVAFEVDGQRHVAERASLPAVRAAFDRWLAEVRSHPENIGVLYFCGHGVTDVSGAHHLLLEDHGQSENRPFETGSFDITNTVRALERIVAAQLYVFVDACRTFSRDVAETMGAAPRPLLQGAASTDNVNRGKTVLEATGDGQPAYGDSKEVSRFTAALLLALKRFCGSSQPGSPRWVINGAALTQTVPTLLHLVNLERGGGGQSCSAHPAGRHDLALHVRDEPPLVVVAIELTPEELRLVGEYAMKNVTRKDAKLITGGKTPGIWRTEAVRGFYTVNIRSRTKKFLDYTALNQDVVPPMYHLSAKVLT